MSVLIFAVSRKMKWLLNHPLLALPPPDSKLLHRSPKNRSGLNAHAGVFAKLSWGAESGLDSDGIHIDRAACRRRDYRHSGRNAPPGFVESKRQSEPHRLREQSSPNGFGDGHVHP